MSTTAEKDEVASLHEEQQVAAMTGQTTRVTDHVRADAIGGDESDLPPGYYRSFAFIGTLVVSNSMMCGLQRVIK